MKVVILGALQYWLGGQMYNLGLSLESAFLDSNLKLPIVGIHQSLYERLKTNLR